MAIFTERSTTLKEAALLPPRFALGATMLYHGASKLKSDGHQQAVGFFEQLGFQPGRPFVLATAVTEVAAGLFSILGFGTRVAALGVLVTQGVAIAKVHSKHGFDNAKMGMEFNLTLCAIALTELLRGPGKLSVHSLLERRVKKNELFRGRFLKKQRLGSRALDWIG